ncbi:MAG: DUF533 domain-containing protein [Gemmatimonadales bacterium]|jgi:uncharacterized protein (DUF697 family)/tellurite resistance protein
MNTTDRAPLIAIAMLAARADGRTDSAEQAAVDAVVAKMGSPDASQLAVQVAGGGIRVADLAAKLSDDEARHTAYNGALAICNVDGPANAAEQAFLDELRHSLGIEVEPVAEVHAGTPPAGPLDGFILQQAIVTGALEILPDQLANIAILPLQLRLVYEIGQRHGQRLDANQGKDLLATLGLGVAAQGVEGLVMGLFGGVARGLLGGLAGGAARVATGAAITFSATYALGHVADQYYAQGRRLSRNDLLALFDRFKQDAKTIYPKVESQIRDRSGSLNLQSLLAGLRGA